MATEKTEKDYHHELDHAPSPNAKDYDLEQSRTVQTDAVFGDITEDGPNYRSVGWKATSALMMKTQIGLGVLSIPAAFDTLGMIPGLICLLVIAATTLWSCHIVGVFKLKHPEVYGIEDVGRMLFGRVGQEVFGLVFALYWACIAGSGMLGISIGLNSLSTHGTCTAAFVAVAAIIGFGFASVQTLGRISWLAWVGLVGILSAIITLTVAVGVQDQPVAAPPRAPGTPWKSDYKMFGNPSFAEALAAISSLILAYAGTPAFFNIVAEMREPRLYTRALITCQSVMTALYVTVGCVVYYYCGSYVTSPALGSAGTTMKKVCYGLALPGLIASTTLCTHFPAKYFMVRTLRGSSHLSSNTLTHWAVWFACVGGTALFAYIIASAVPVFGGLVSLIGALFGTLMSFQPMGCMWLYDHFRSDDRTRWQWKAMVAWCVVLIAMGSFLMVGGTYGSINEIIVGYRKSGGSAAWSCADNSGST